MGRVSPAEIRRGSEAVTEISRARKIILVRRSAGGRTSALASEPQPHHELYQSRLIDLGRNIPCGRVRRRSQLRVRKPELHPVEQVVDLRAKLQIEALRNWRLLRQREVEIVNSLPAENWIGRAFIPQRVTGWHAVARDIEPARQPRCRRSADYRIAAGDNIWPPAIARPVRGSGRR